MIAIRNPNTYQALKSLIVLYYEDSNEYEQLNSLSTQLLTVKKFSITEFSKVLREKDNKHRQVIQHLCNLTLHPSFIELTAHEQNQILDLFNQPVHQPT